MIELLQIFIVQFISLVLCGCRKGSKETRQYSFVMIFALSTKLRQKTPVYYILNILHDAWPFVGKGFETHTFFNSFLLDSALL